MTNTRRRLRTLNILDEGVCEALAIEVDTSLQAKQVVRGLQRASVAGSICPTKPEGSEFMRGPNNPGRSHRG